MEITARQLINPGVAELDQKRREAIARFKEAVVHAKFLGENEKLNWTYLGYLLNSEQLIEAQKLIINQDLKYLRKFEIIQNKEK